MNVRFSYAVPLIALLAVACSASTGTNGKEGTPGAEGGNGEDGAPAGEAGKKTAAINLVEPRVGLVARQIQVMVSVDGKIDMGKAKLDFGDGVKVVQAGKIGNSLGAIIEISPQAKLGKHDVTITLGGNEKIVAKGGFVVAVPLDAKMAGGKAEQGGLVRLDVRNRDKDLWFDTENFRLFPLAKQGEGTMIPLSHTGFTLTDGTVVLLGDPLAKTGKMGFLGFNNPDDDNSIPFLTESDVVDVAARAPTALVPGTPLDKTFANELETAFYSSDIAPASGQGLLVEAFAAVPPDSNMQPLLLAYPASGRAAELVGQGAMDPGFPIFGIPPTDAKVAYPVTEASKAFFIVLDAANGHGASTKMALNYSATPALIISEKPGSTHGTPETAQNLGSLPGFQANVLGRIVKGELLAADEVDLYKFTGLSANNATDMQVSIISDADIVVRVDTVPTFDSEGVIEIGQSGKAGSATTLNLSGPDRFISVTSVPKSQHATGKYSIGVKRAQPIITQNQR